MRYNASIEWSSNGKRLDDHSVSIEKEGLKLGEEFLDYADIDRLRPINHKVILTKMDGESVTVSMLGFSFDGFWDDLISCFGERTADSLFIQEKLIMKCEGEYVLPIIDDKCSGSEVVEAGRGMVMLYEDSVVILPESSHAIRIPLCFTDEIILNGYQITLKMRTKEAYTVGKMGYDTKPFFERCEGQAKKTKAERKFILSGIEVKPPFTDKGLFRTYTDQGYWLTAFGKNTAAVELFTGENTATYLYRFDDRELFTFRLEEAMEAMGIHREIIFLPEEQISEKPLYRMAVHRSKSVRFLRNCSAGRIIHNSSHAEKLSEFLFCLSQK